MDLGGGTVSKQRFKRITSLLLSAAMLFSFMPITVPEVEAVDTGQPSSKQTKAEQIHLYAMTDENTYTKMPSGGEVWKNRVQEPLDKAAGKKLNRLGYTFSTYSWGQIWRDASGGWDVSSNSIDEFDKVVNHHVGYLEAINPNNIHQDGVVDAQKSDMQNLQQTFITGMTEKDEFENFHLQFYANDYSEEQCKADGHARESKAIYDAIEQGKELYINIAPKNSAATLSGMFNIPLSAGLDSGVSVPQHDPVTGTLDPTKAKVESIKKGTTANGTMGQYVITITLPLKVELMDTKDANYKWLDPENPLMQNWMPVPKEGYGFASASTNTVADWREAYERNNSDFLKDTVGPGTPIFWFGKSGIIPQGVLTPNETSGKLAFGMPGLRNEFQNEFLSYSKNEALAKFSTLYEKYRVKEGEKKVGPYFLIGNDYHDYTPYGDTFYADMKNGYMNHRYDKSKANPDGKDMYRPVSTGDLNKSYAFGTWTSFQSGSAGLYIDWNISAEIFTAEKETSVVKYFYDNSNSPQSFDPMKTLDKIEKMREVPDNTKYEKVPGRVYKTNGTEDGYYLDTALVISNGILQGTLKVQDNQVWYTTKEGYMFGEEWYGESGYWSYDTGEDESGSGKGGAYSNSIKIPKANAVETGRGIPIGEVVAWMRAHEPLPTDWTSTYDLIEFAKLVQLIKDIYTNNDVTVTPALMKENLAYHIEAFDADKSEYLSNLVNNISQAELDSIQKLIDNGLHSNMGSTIKYSNRSDQLSGNRKVIGSDLTWDTKDIDNIQLVLLYLKKRPPNTITTDDGKTISSNTFVTKMYYANETDKEPLNIVTEQLYIDDTDEADKNNGIKRASSVSKDKPYKITAEDEDYKLKEWVYVEDKDPENPEPGEDPYQRWEDVPPLGEKNTQPKDLYPNDFAGKEVFIKYVLPADVHVTKMYYQSESDPKPYDIRSEVLDPKVPYNITNEGDYKVKGWGVVEDKVPNEPEPYKKWPEVIPNIIGPSGYSPATIQPKDIQPSPKNKELFVKYVKDDVPPPPPINPDIILPEKRISWLKTLKDLGGGVPTITFTWPAITGSESHGCGSGENYHTHPCDEGTSWDTFFRFVSTNLLPIKDKIVGNKTNFMPFDVNNVYEKTRGEEGGTYEMHPDYGFVIWRGQDLPTIAKYKYDGTTSGNTVANKTARNVIKNLIGAGQEGKSPVGKRHVNNGHYENTKQGYYTDNFSIKEGKSNYDTGNSGSYSGLFGSLNNATETSDSTADIAFNALKNNYHDASKELITAKGEVKMYTEEQAEALANLNEKHQTHDSHKEAHSSSKYYSAGGHDYWVEPVYDCWYMYHSHYGHTHDDDCVDYYIIHMKEYSQCDKCKAAQNWYDNATAKLNAAKAREAAAQAVFDTINAKLIQAQNDTQTNNSDHKINITAGSKHLGDYDYNTHWSYCGRENWGNATGNSQQYNPKVKVDVGYGKPNTGNKDVSFKPNTSTDKIDAFGIKFDNVTGFPINNKTSVKFYPYVEMLFDTTMGQTDQSVYVLAGHPSTFIPKDYVEIGYKTYSGGKAGTNHATGLLLQSQQWSTHAKALNLGPRDTVLPGGAIYRLITPKKSPNNSSTPNVRTQVCLTTWQTFLPNDTIEATLDSDKVKASYSGTAQDNRRKALFAQIANAFNNLDIVQHVAGNQKKDAIDDHVLYEKRGKKEGIVKGTSGQPTSTDTKYWLKQNGVAGKANTDANPIFDGTGKVKPATLEEAIKVKSALTNEADLDVTATEVKKTYYRIRSDSNGNVYVSKSYTSQEDTMSGKGTVLAQATKTEGESKLLANAEVKALNDRTNLVTNYLKAIDRNLGNDTTLTSGGPTWYNEAFDGICVVRTDMRMELGFKDGNDDNAANKAQRVAALDPKLCPPNVGQSDIFSKGVKSWFSTDKHTNLSNEAGYLASIDPLGGGQKVKISLANMDSLYRTKDFTIPNATVMNLY